MSNVTDNLLLSGGARDPAEHRFLARNFSWPFGESRPNRDAALAAGGAIKDVVENEENAELAQLALVALNQAIAADLRQGGLPLDERPTDGAFYFAAQQYLDARALLEVLPRHRETREKLQEIHKLASRLCSALANVDILTLHALERSGLFGQSCQYFVIADLKEDSIKEIFGSTEAWYDYIAAALHNDRYHFAERNPGMLTTLLGHINECAQRAAENVPRDKGNERHPAGRNAAQEMVQTCVEIFAVYCPSQISGGAGSLFREFVSYAWQAAAGTDSDCGRNIRSIVRQYRQVEKNPRQADGYHERRWADIIAARKSIAGFRSIGEEASVFCEQAKMWLGGFTSAYRRMDRISGGN